MKIVSIEPTPSPNTMKILLDQELSMGKSNNYKKDSAEGAPEVIKEILKIEGIKGVYHVADFLAVERNAKFDWKLLLPHVRAAFGNEETKSDSISGAVQEHFGEINVSVQMFKNIPMQVKLSDGETEKRFGLPESFSQAVREAEQQGDNVVMLRKWNDYGIRYGDMSKVGEEVVEELAAAYNSERLQMLVNRALAGENTSYPQRQARVKVTINDWSNPDWQHRYRLLEQMEDPDLGDLPVLEKALNDEKPAIRRLATVYLGMIKDTAVLPLLYKALKDKTVTVRRTAGDCLSDLGFPEAAEEMTKALKDKSKLVRWRAAMFLFEEGDESSLPALKEAENDPEFEVSLQIKMAIERIEGGESAKGSVWKQMTEARKER